MPVSLCKVSEFEDCVGEAEGTILVFDVGCPYCYSISILTKQKIKLCNTSRISLVVKTLRYKSVGPGIDSKR